MTSTSLGPVIERFTREVAPLLDRMDHLVPAVEAAYRAKDPVATLTALEELAPVGLATHEAMAPFIRTFTEVGMPRDRRRIFELTGEAGLGFWSARAEAKAFSMNPDYAASVSRGDDWVKAMNRHVKRALGAWEKAHRAMGPFLGADPLR